MEIQVQKGQQGPQFWPRIERFRTVTPVWIHRWLRNDAQCLGWHRRGTFFFKVIRQISRSHRPKNWRFCSDLSFFGWQLRFEFTDGYEMTQIAFRSMVDMPYCFSMSSVKFQGHTGRKIEALVPIWTFPDHKSNLNSQLAMKWQTLLCWMLIKFSSKVIL